ncbi:LysR family transcriptional regulator [Vibrio sonorensis]|uniref:LysR family transcriptional regulator n=1 Tax=Vibrio sonorensis TaxID=1004316 RepID=UPI0008DAF835|nr:LysR family transcriptional regulator [Vibrio sonorensis]
MNIENLARLDLSQLICLRVLLEELNVTRAANRLCLSQSAVSKSLAKLRVQFNDRLFVRHSHGLRATPKALFLRPKLDSLIHHLEQLSLPETFDPSTTQHRFNIAAVESVYPLILPHFLPHLFSNAPGITLSTHAWSEDTFKKMQSGDIDIGITGKDIDINDAKLTMLPPPDICEQEIYRDKQMCLVRRDHPVLSENWSLDTYLRQRHVQVRCDGNERWLLDYKLAELGKQRDIAISVPDFNSAASLCTYTDFVFTAPNHFVTLTAKQMDLVVLDLPLHFPEMAYTLFWHSNRASDPALTWLKNIIQEKTESLR